MPVQPLLERKLERDLLLTLAADVAAGRSRLAVVTGEAGVGKSRLCREVVDELPDSWPRLVHHRTGPDLPDDGPAAVIVEDLHDADPDTPDQLRDLLENGPPALVLCTHRLGAGDGPARRGRAYALLRTPGVVEVRLSPLSEAATVELARRLGAIVDDDAAARLFERTGGNPFFIEELLGADGSHVPWTVTASVLDRVDELPRSEREAVEALAVAGRCLPRAVLDRLVDSDESITHTLTDRQLAVTVDDGVRLRHDIVGEVVADRLGSIRTEALHRAIAGALAAESDPPAHRIAHHLLRAGDRVRALPWARAGAEHAVEQRMFARATSLFRVLIEPGPVDPGRPGATEADDTPLPGALLEQAALAAAQAGRTELAERWAHQAESVYRAEGDTHRATALWLDQSLAYIRRPVLDPGELSPGAAPRLAADAAAAARHGDAPAALSLARRALAVALEQGDSDAGGAAAHALLLAGAPDEAVSGLERLRQQAMLADQPVHESHRSLDLARCAAALGDHVEAEAQQLAGLAAMARLPECGEQPLLVVGLAAILASAGDLDRADELAAPLLHDDNIAVATVARLPMTMIDLARGRVDRARGWLAEMAPYRTMAGPDMFGIVVAQEALLHLRTGDLARADAVLVEAEEWIGGRFDISRPDRIELALRIAILRGDDDALDRLAVEAGRLADHPEAGPGLHGLADLAAGLASVQHDRPGLGLAHLEAAARHLSDAPRIVHAADAWCDAALAARSAGDPARCDAALAEASALAAPRGLAPVLARIAAIAAAASEGPGATGELAMLTPREKTIIRLVAGGLTNKEIAAALHLSDKTVRNQLSLLFSKLGIERRAQAAAFAVRHGLADGDA